LCFQRLRCCWALCWRGNKNRFIKVEWCSDVVPWIFTIELAN
jgi:hypothetical protein